MRFSSAALLVLSLTGCGISQAAHQKALDQQRDQLMASSAKVAAELKAQLAEAQAQTQKAREATQAQAATTGAVKHQLADAQAKLALALAASEARDLEALALEHKVPEALQLATKVETFAKSKQLDAVVQALDEGMPLLQKKVNKRTQAKVMAQAAGKFSDAADALDAKAQAQ